VTSFSGVLDRRLLKTFGTVTPGVEYKDRTASYGILVRDGKIAVVQIGITKFEYDLPGGGCDPFESPEKAVVREYLEETGLLVKVVQPITQFVQLFAHKNGDHYLNLAHVFEVDWIADRPSAKCETDHELIWMSPLECVKSLDKEGFAWAVVAWLRGMRAKT
jgi:8-oxo-dGTP diphosphatase